MPPADDHTPEVPEISSFQGVSATSLNGNAPQSQVPDAGAPEAADIFLAGSEPAEEARKIDLETPAARQPAPAAFEERISAIDTLRGFALLGILLMNILAFAMPFQATANPTVMGGDTGWNLVTWFAGYVLWDGKMRAIFSMMFGASVYLLVDRLTRRGCATDAADIHYRRMLWMLLFGMIHGYLIWFGDILFAYAMLGLILFPLRKLSPKALVAAAGVMILLLSLAGVGNGFRFRTLKADYDKAMADEKAGKKLTDKQQETVKAWKEALKEVAPPPEEIQKEVDGYRGNYLENMAVRARWTWQMHSFPLYFPFLWDMLSMMLIGIALMKWNVLTAERSSQFYGWMAVIGFGVGLPAHAFSAWFVMHNQFSPEALGFQLAFYEVGRFTALGYCAVLLLMVKHGVMRGVMRLLARVGQMAFSNYILTSLICTTIFYGFGYGLFGKLQRWQLYPIVLAVWLELMLFSHLWLKYYRFGPLEWIWRSLTYWKKQPMRLPIGAPVAEG